MADKRAIQCALEAANRTDVVNDPWQYIACFFGEQTQEMEKAIPVTVVNSILFVTGLVGNLIVCIVIITHQSLQSPTNYYLLNLALSDVTLILFGLPYDISLYWRQYPWIFGEFVCKARALISEMASYVSVLTVVAFSTERYLAICHPLYKLAISSLQRALRIIICLWILSFLSAIPFAIYSEVDYVNYPLNSTNYLPESAFCGMTSLPEDFPLTEISTVIFFIIPMVVILYQYIKMGMAIKQATINDGLGKAVHGSVHRKNKKNSIHSKGVVKMLFFVVLGFFGCWFPFHIQRVLSVYCRTYEYYEDMNSWMYFITGIFYYLSSTLNPIIYNVMSDRMRNAFKEIICKRKPEKKSINSSHDTSKGTSHIIVSYQNSSATNGDDEKLQLVKRDQITMFDPKLKSQLIYEISEEHESKGQCLQRTETCI